MSADTFKIGDVVELKSGGPKMTVKTEVHNEVASCFWFEDGDIAQHYFSVATLKLAESQS